MVCPRVLVVCERSRGCVPPGTRMEVTGAGQRDGSVGAQQRDGAGRYRGRSRLGTRGGLEAATVSRAQDRGGRVDRGVAGVPPRELCVGRAEQRAEAARLSELGSAEPDGGASVPLERRLGRHAWSYLAPGRSQPDLEDMGAGWMELYYGCASRTRPISHPPRRSLCAPLESSPSLDFPSSLTS